MIQLSKRLQAVADYVSKGTTVADIGTDHGYIPIYLTVNNICKKAYAMDVRKGPLEHAKANIERMGLSDRIEARLSDGLSKLQSGEADTVVISGMGGHLTTEILEAGKDALESVEELVLCPHADVDVVRHYLHDNNYMIEKETMLIDEGKFYNIIKAHRGSEVYDREVYYQYGKKLLEQQDSVLKEFLDIERDKYLRVRDILKNNDNEAGQKRLIQVEEIIKYMDEGLEFFK
ncbi:class I SAM-dependent methyltransferase [Falcatimonas sp. MSJ-15]|uniref:tRNA (adenine(22)-N(1))-methyltransferase n=1 Tax=Falcatimonas sp. MSJ-15 TaxID=2841515 RepID=UPI0020A066DB|nr:class I SAM-dependent methyltransferase [Falcatimonas sp. MSJ-15]